MISQLYNTQNKVKLLVPNDEFLHEMFTIINPWEFAMIEWGTFYLFIVEFFAT